MLRSKHFIGTRGRGIEDGSVGQRDGFRNCKFHSLCLASVSEFKYMHSQFRYKSEAEFEVGVEVGVEVEGNFKSEAESESESEPDSLLVFANKAAAAAAETAATKPARLPVKLFLSSSS